MHKGIEVKTYKKLLKRKDRYIKKMDSVKPIVIKGGRASLIKKLKVKQRKTYP